MTRPVPVRVHRAKDAQGLLPAIVTIHGGGYVIGSYDMDSPLLDRWCPGLGVVGVSVEYRLAPETPYPGPLEDCYAALRWTYDNAAELGIDKDRIGLYGLSAGGGLAAALALLARDRGEVPLAFVLLDCPMLDDRQQTPSIQAEGLYVWGSGSNEFGWRSYLGDALRLRRGPALRRRGPGGRPGRASSDLRGRRLHRRLPRRGHRLRPAPEPGRACRASSTSSPGCRTPTSWCPARPPSSSPCTAWTTGWPVSWPGCPPADRRIRARRPSPSGRGSWRPARRRRPAARRGGRCRPARSCGRSRRTSSVAAAGATRRRGSARGT